MSLLTMDLEEVFAEEPPIAETTLPRLLFFLLTHVLSGFLEGLAPLVAYAYYTFQRWMSGLERR